MTAQPTYQLSFTFDAAFNEVYNNLSSNKAPGLNLYERSFWLTKAQEDLVKGYYKGSIGEGFEVTEEMRRYLSTLVKTAKITPIAAGSETTTLSENSYICNLPEKLWFITYEGAIIDGDGECNDKNIAVVPITQDELWKVINNPFRGPTDRRVLRLDYGTDGTNNKVELISNGKTISNYTVRYLEKLSPIILCNLHDLNTNLYIDDEYEETVCQLDSSLHRTIIEAAAKMALLSWSPGTATS